MVEYVYHVDEEDNVIEKITKKEAIDKLMIHRSASTLIFNSKDKIFAQLRAKNRKLYPDKWEIGIGGSVDYGETYEEGAIRELREETGIVTDNLELLFKHLYRDKFVTAFCQRYKLIYDGPITLSDEGQEYRWISIEELKKMMKKGAFRAEDLMVWERYENG